MAFIPYLYRIEAQTNMHVGSGKQSYAIIDNLVQREYVSQLPVINASSWKGALREFFTQQLSQTNDKLTGTEKALVDYVFGKESTREDKDNEAGKYRFFDAYLLGLPVRSDQRAFYIGTSRSVLELLGTKLENFGHKLEAQNEALRTKLIDEAHEQQAYIFDTTQEAYLEDIDKKASFKNLTTDTWKELLGAELALLPNKMLSELCDDTHLPVVARNSLEDGRSTNLWYEQIVPRQSNFFTLVLVPDHDTNHFEGFNEVLTQRGLIQIGANASIGYGFCQVTQIPITKETP